MPWLLALASAAGSGIGAAASAGAGALGSAAGAAGSALGSAGSAIGSGLSSAGGAIGDALVGSGGEGLAGGLAGPTAPATQGLIGAGGAIAPAQGAIGQALGAGEAGHVASLGQAVPQGVEMVGPNASIGGAEQSMLFPSSSPAGGAATGGQNFMVQGIQPPAGLQGDPAAATGTMGKIQKDIAPIMQMIQSLKDIGKGDPPPASKLPPPPNLDMPVMGNMEIGPPLSFLRARQLQI